MKAKTFALVLTLILALAYLTSKAERPQLKEKTVIAPYTFLEKYNDHLVVITFDTLNSQLMKTIGEHQLIPSTVNQGYRFWFPLNKEWEILYTLGITIPTNPQMVYKQ